MNIEEYISSGILEAYALGELSAAEQTAVEKNLLHYPELREELRHIEEVQEQLMIKAAIRPKASVKAQLFNTLLQPPSGKVVAMQSPAWKRAAAASLALAVLTSYLAYEYHDRWRTSEANLTTLIAQNRQMAQDYNIVNERIDKMQTDMNVIGSPEFSRVVMKGSDHAPGSMAYVYWNEKTEEVYLSIQNMKELAYENQYQLWAMVDGKPIDAGVFDMHTVNGLQRMKGMKGATAFAVTIEPRGGRPVPTLEKLQMIGEVGKS